MMAYDLSEHPVRPCSPKDKDRAEADLCWWFCERESALGLHGAGFEPSGGLHVDADLDPTVAGMFEAGVAASTWRVSKLASFRVKQAARKEPIVRACLDALAPKTLAVAEAIYEPRPYPVPLEFYFRVESSQVSLVGLAMLTEPWREAFQAAMRATERRVARISADADALLTLDVPRAFRWLRREKLGRAVYARETAVRQLAKSTLEWAHEAVTPPPGKSSYVPPAWLEASRELAIGLRGQLLVEYADVSRGIYGDAAKRRKSQRAAEDAAYRRWLRGGQ